MPVTVYLSDNPGAPVLTGMPGSLITVLDACLINGYGAKVGAGWTKAFGAVNKAAYRQGAGSLGQYINVNDDAPVVSNEARVHGFEIMTGILVGVNPYPQVTVRPLTVGINVRKSATTDVVARPWIIVADQRTMYMWVLTGDIAGTYYGWAFGEYYSFKLNDPGRNFIQARYQENSSSTSGATADGFDQSTWVGGQVIGMFVNRDVSGAAGGIYAGKMADWELTLNGTASMRGILGFTNPADSRVYLAPLRVNSNTSDLTIRGRLRGLWFFTHPIESVSDRDTFIGVEDLAGKTFMIIKKSGNNAVWCVEISDTWETN